MGWLDDPGLRTNPMVRSVGQYVRERDAMEAYVRETFNTGLDGKGRTPEAEQALVAIRTQLREIATQISQGLPEFQTVWDRIFGQEVSQEHDGWSSENVDFYGSDFFTEVLGVPRNMAMTYGESQEEQI
jgi:hypothetical protein